MHTHANQYSNLAILIDQQALEILLPAHQGGCKYALSCDFYVGNRDQIHVQILPGKALYKLSQILSHIFNIKFSYISSYH